MASPHAFRAAEMTTQGSGSHGYTTPRNVVPKRDSGLVNVIMSCLGNAMSASTLVASNTCSTHRG